ncbi:phage major capsid protein [Mesorhizobium sp. B1-1-9]|uniref:phage major capsid protein n=1 Tax=Mesorhizobium sp. B1-1-9 TaxID=2589975 RepID=UPI0015E281A3|nr:phage major capsid protein [Mesorhizobium sp. B1-1-9]
MRAGMFFRAAMHKGDDVAEAWCAKNGIIMQKAQGESTGTVGGYLVPTEVEAGIIKIRALVGTFRRNADIKRMGSDTRSFPRLDTNLTAAFVGENAQIAEQDRAWSSVTLTAKKAAALSRMSSELGEDETVDLGNDFAQDAAYAISKLEDDCGWLGDGTSAYGGISGVTSKLIDGAHDAGKVVAATNNDTFDEITATDLGTVVAACPEYALANAKWYASSYAIGRTFVRLGATVVGLEMTPTGPKPILQYGSYLIEPVPSLPGSGDQSGKVMLAFGDLSMAATLGDRRGVTVKTTEQRYLEYDQIGCRATARFDINVHDLGSNSVAGPLVGLIGN